MQPREYWAWIFSRTIDRSLGRLYLSQSQYIVKVLHHFHMSHAKPVSTPLTTHFKLSTSSGPSNKEEDYGPVWLEASQKFAWPGPCLGSA